MNKLIFHRYHGLGNDYLVCRRSVADRLSNQQIQRICDRHYGLGSDGLLIDIDDLDVPTLRIINPDGSEAEKSGNGLRIYARYLFDIGRVKHSPFFVNTLGGQVRCEVTEGAHQVIVDMGQANFTPAALPASVEGEEVLALPLLIDGHKLTASLVSMGNPHCVIQVKELDLALVQEIGGKIETMPIFPKRTNVQFVEVQDRSNIRIGIWERGAGYTLASGSSSCAAASAMRKLGLVDDNVTVHMPGGRLAISFSGYFQVKMCGPVQKISTSMLDEDCFFDMQPDIGQQ
ncbi:MULTISPECIES: diaminopimelate epimerase [unclassified Serratia (in: enterobacteria)]|uniref:diaminopimelate epimerase n=1 Tax=unclassified Serratia (in: enterobacteria) TaxID=2647522 RepID=UPI0018A9223A|nr:MULTISPECIES: diaminopimelate epimerase [unclassified Serratia (in: enterobacteria)]